MNVPGLTTTDVRLPPAWRKLSHGESAVDFAATFRAQAVNGDSGSRDDIRDAGAKLVASALVLPAMESLQQTSLRLQSGPFATSSVEKRFAPMLHQAFADRVTGAANFNLVDVIVEHVTRQRGSEP